MNKEKKTQNQNNRVQMAAGGRRGTLEIFVLRKLFDFW